VGPLAVLVGLGNPGRSYARTRHNVGFRVAEEIARRAGVSLSTKKFGALAGRGTVAGRAALLVLPQTYMNLSGEAVASLLGYFRAEPADLVVVHDDLDLPFGRIQVKQGGGIAGHRGLASIVERLGTDDFARIRVGIGRPEVGDAVDYVLERFTDDQERGLPPIIERAADAVEAVLADGVTRAMNRFNAWKDPNSDGEDR
jgi:PTH1 family peptidyl-tRNA hydrolase